MPTSESPAYRQRIDDALRLDPPPSPGEWSRGAGPDAPTLVVYADFDCPDCRAFHEAWTGLPPALTERIRFVHRHFPQVTSHPRAMQSALAAEAAGAQGSFWPMYDRLLGVGRDREAGSTFRFARELALDMDRFVEDMRRRTHTSNIWRDLRTGRASGVEDTPGVFLDGNAYRAPLDPEALLGDVRSWLDSARGGSGG